MEDRTVRRQFVRFVEELREPGSPSLSPDRFARALGLQPRELADRARVHSSTVAGSPGSEALQAYMRGVVRVLSAAVGVADGDLATAITWFRSHRIPELRHNTADQLVTDGQVDEVIAYIDSISAGYAG